MENNLAAIIVYLDDIIKQFDANNNKWHTSKTRHFDIAAHIDDDNAHYARLMALKNDLIKEAALRNQITIAESVAVDPNEIDHPGR